MKVPNMSRYDDICLRNVIFGNKPGDEAEVGQDTVELADVIHELGLIRR